MKGSEEVRKNKRERQLVAAGATPHPFDGRNCCVMLMWLQCNANIGHEAGLSVTSSIFRFPRFPVYTGSLQHERVAENLSDQQEKSRK